MKQKGFFDENDRLIELSKMGDPLEKLNKHIRWEDLREKLTTAFKNEPKGPAGRPPYDYVMMFKILILQKLYSMADDATEYIIKDRLSFQRFLGLALCDTVPDAKTVWNFRDVLQQSKVLDAVFNQFVEETERKGIVTHSGSIVDATFTDVPKQRNTKEENEMIREGKIPEEWKEEKNRNKKAQKDTDAHWAVKNKEVHYGYKNHVKVDKKSKIITRYEVTSAEVHDSQKLKDLIEPAKDRRLYGDSAYTGEEVQACIPEGVLNRIHEKGYRNKPLTKTQKRNNTAKSRIRARVEHVFGRISQFGGTMIRSIGMARAETQIGLINMAYNLTRYAYLMGAKA
jgi:IS5 family transposase